METPGAVPDDVTLQAISPCRKDALQRTVNSLRGARRAIVFTYISTSENYRETIFGMSEDECVQQVTDCIAFVKSITVDDPTSNNTEWRFGFGCEDFSNARPGFIVRLGEAVKTAWGPTVEKPLIFGLAASVEGTTPNVFADQVEYFLTHITERRKISLSIHPHNDRGCAVAAAELGCLAGADMVEGCLFGNGERAGNVDLVTLALNFLRLGINPGIDFSNLAKVRAIVEDITKIPVHPRAPYVGDYYFLALSGTHQDAIRKGFSRRDDGGRAMSDGTMNGTDKTKAWCVPYLPMDPADVGIEQANIIGISSQSGKSGILWMLQHTLGLHPPKELAMLFSQAIKNTSMEQKQQLAAKEICSLFLDTYHERRFNDGVAQLSREGSPNIVSIDIGSLEKHIPKETEDSVVMHSAVAKLSHALDVDLSCVEYSSHIVEKRAQTSAFVKCSVDGKGSGSWGVGIGSGLAMAYLSAIVSSVTVGFVLSLPFSVTLS